MMRHNTDFHNAVKKILSQTITGKSNSAIPAMDFTIILMDSDTRINT